MHYLKTAEARVSQAQKESHEVVENIDDLDQAESPEKYANVYLVYLFCNI